MTAPAPLIGQFPAGKLVAMHAFVAVADEALASGELVYDARFAKMAHQVFDEIQPDLPEDSFFFHTALSDAH